MQEYWEFDERSQRDCLSSQSSGEHDHQSALSLRHCSYTLVLKTETTLLFRLVFVKCASLFIGVFFSSLLIKI